MKKFNLIVSSLIMFFVIVSLTNVVKADPLTGTVEALTGSPSITPTSSSENIEVKYQDLELDWAKADPGMGRTKNGWWVGIKLTAPSSADFENAYFSIQRLEGTAQKSVFKDVEDSPVKSGIDNRFVNIWLFIDSNDLDGKSGDIQLGKIEADWNNDTSTDQTITITINVEKTQLKTDPATMSTVVIKDSVTSKTKSFTVEKNGSLDSLDSVQKEELKKFTEKSGYKFLGFFKDPGDTKFETSETISEETLNLTAKFEKIPESSGSAPSSGPAESAPAAVAEKDNTPKTGSNNITTYFVVMLLLSSMGIILLNKKH